MTYRLFQQPFPELFCEQVRLRELTTADASSYYHYMSDAEVKRYIPDEDVPDTEQDAYYELVYWSGLFERQQSIYWGVEDKETQQLIGTAGFHQWNKEHQRAEISYDLAKPYWGQGIMTEIVSALIDFARSDMHIHRIAASAAKNNIGSIRVLEKAGFAHEGVMRDYKKVHGTFCDFVLCSYIVAEN